MLEVWKAKIKADIPGHVWPYCDLDVRKHLFGNGSKVTLETDSLNRLSKYYYFSKNFPKDPIIAHQTTTRDIGIHPGTSRFIGSIFRDEKVWLDALIYTEVPILSNPNIIWLEKINSIQDTDGNKESWKHFDKNDWENHEEYKNLLIKDSQNARIEIISELEERIVFNPEGSWSIVENIKNHSGIISTIKSIFEKIKDK